MKGLQVHGVHAVHGILPKRNGRLATDGVDLTNQHGDLRKRVVKTVNPKP